MGIPPCDSRKRNRGTALTHSLPDHFPSIPVERLWGAGPKISRALREKGIETAEDLLYFCPISYEDRRTISPIGEAEEGSYGSFTGRIVSSGFAYHRHSRKRGFQALLEDDTGSISLDWFNYPGPHLKKLLDSQCSFFVSGVVSRFGSQRQLIHPYVAPIGEGGPDDERRVIPVYSEIQGVGQSVIRKLMKEAYQCAISCGFHGLVGRSFEEEHRLLPFCDALTLLHFPRTAGSGLQAEARLRLVFEEFFSFQAALLLKRNKPEVKGYIPPRVAGSYAKNFLTSLPFAPTAAQRRVMKEIEADMARNVPMNRLIQGDVGCGKTMCTTFACCLSLDRGFQVALIAPTEILAEQHYLSMGTALQTMGLNVALLTSSTARERDTALKGLHDGTIHFVVGTHALLEEDVRLSRLGLVIIDEQHKFGVLQRKAFTSKAAIPNILAITATPIPRTLSIVLYGHLDLSVIDEMPPGRLPVKTVVWDNEQREQAYGLVRDKLERGGQAYLVFPVIEERGEDGLSGVLNRYEELTKGPFRGFTTGLLHGRLSLNDKDRVMEAFKKGEIQLLACTTVIEVGLDLPNASAIVVHHAERFGLAQLHQLRGRVGRGARESICILLADKDTSDTSKERLQIMEETSDGFQVAEADMMLRGPGELLGVRQSGLPKFRLGDLRDHGAVMSRARDLARDALLVLNGENLSSLRGAVIERWGKDQGLVEA